MYDSSNGDLKIQYYVDITFYCPLRAQNCMERITEMRLNYMHFARSSKLVLLYITRMKLSL